MKTHSAPREFELSLLTAMCTPLPLLLVLLLVDVRQHELMTTTHAGLFSTHPLPPLGLPHMARLPK